MQNFKEYLGLGIAGNFAMHLDQAGEAEDFKDIVTEDESAPKGIFPFYLPKKVDMAKDVLNTYPLSSSFIKLPNSELNVQAEPEVCLVCEVIYEDDKVSTIIPKLFGAYNDCSIRVAGAKKISDKKNWGENSKGVSQTLFDIDKFSDGSLMEEFSIVSFLRRDEKLTQYGEDAKLTGYSYFYEKLISWIVNQINTQKDFGPLEPINQYIKECQNPTNLIISIGATRYTEYGETTFLKDGDEVVVIVYNHNKISFEDLQKNIENKNYNIEDVSILSQKVVL